MVTLAKAPTTSTDFEHWLRSLSIRWANQQRECLRQAHETALHCLPDSRHGLTAAGLLSTLRLDHEAVCAAMLQEAFDAKPCHCPTFAVDSAKVPPAWSRAFRGWN